MKPTYAFPCALLGFIDCMFGFLSLIYLNIQQYRHKELGSHEEVLVSYILAIYGFFKGLGLCITAAQLAVDKTHVILGRWTCVLWLIMSIPQLGVCIVLGYNFVYPMGMHKMTDIFLFVVRDIYLIFLVVATVFVFLLWLQVERAIPKVEKEAKPRRTVRKNATGTTETANGNQDVESG